MKMKKVLSERLKRGHNALYSVSYQATIREAAISMTNQKIGAMLVESPSDSKQFSGIITERDIMRCCARKDDLDSVAVNDVMSTELVTVDVEDLVNPVVALMTKKHIRHIMLTENGNIIALISIRDIMHANEAEKDLTIAELSDYVGCTRRNKVY